MSIMGNAKPFASLSSGLLARKGQARPAMRPQGYVGHEFGGADLAALSSVSAEDLGWNDMGYDPPAAPMETAVPPVLRQRERLDDHFQPADVVAEQPAEPQAAAPVLPAAPVAARAVSDGMLKRIGRETKPKKSGKGATAKAAFTLRLDAERHLRLRLASAITKRSAQQLVSDALDTYLAQLSELDALVERVPGRRAG